MCEVAGRARVGRRERRRPQERKDPRHSAGNWESFVRRYSRERPDRCRFRREGVEKVDYKDVGRLAKLMTGEARMFSRKRSGNCAGHQRLLKRAVKKARYMALLPYTSTR